jgi:hypothetical protein
MTPKDREKRWIKQKGCRNAARMWREDMGMWVVVPMNIDKPFTYVTPKWEAKKVYFKKTKMKPIVFKSSPEQKARFTESLATNTPKQGKK